MNTTVLIIVIYILVTALHLTMVIITISYDGNVFLLKLLPQDLKEQTRMNWFGCIVTSLSLLAITPIVWIGRFIYWLFHIERREDERSE